MLRLDNKEEIEKYILASKEYLAAPPHTSMPYPFPVVRDKCPICGRVGCARWKGYYLRKVICAELGIDDDIAIHVGHCQTKGVDFSYMPSFLLPYRRISRESLRKFIQSWLNRKKMAEIIDDFVAAMPTDDFNMAMSTAYDWLSAILIPLRLHSNELGIFEFPMCAAELRNLPAATIDRCFEAKCIWTPAKQIILAPD